jgi:hypothetical protein
MQHEGDIPRDVVQSVMADAEEYKQNRERPETGALAEGNTSAGG